MVLNAFHGRGVALISADQTRNAERDSGVDGPAQPGTSSFDQNAYYSSRFAQQIESERTNLWISFGFTLIVLAGSLLASWRLFRNAGPAGTYLEYMKLGPIAISGIALPFPVRMYLSYRVRIPIYKLFKSLFDDAAARGEQVHPQVLDDAKDAVKQFHRLS